MNVLASRIAAANAEILVAGELAAIADHFAPDYVAHFTETDMRGHTGIRRFASMVRRAFPDLQVEVEVLVESEERIAWQRTLSGTHSGDYAGFPASGARIVWRDMVTSRFADQKIVEDWAISDLAEQLLKQRHSATQ